MSAIERSTPKQALAIYLAGLAPSGRRTMRSCLVRAAEILQPGRELDRIDWHHLTHDHLAAVRLVLGTSKAPATVNKHLVALRGLLKQLWMSGLMPEDQYRRAIAVPNVKAERLPAGRALSEEELALLQAEARAQGLEYEALLALLYNAGLRRSEAAAVTKGSVRLGEGWTAWISLIGKGNKQRQVPVRGDGMRALMRLVGELQHSESRLLGRAGGRGVAKMLERLCACAGIPRCSPHDLRRTFITRALARGAPLASVSRMAGHEDPRTTMRYDRRPDDAMVEVADVLGL